MFNFKQIIGTKQIIGNKAEKLALTYLKKQGLRPITKNYLTKLGEIDIIMLDKHNNALVFVEVRYRKNNDFGSALETVSSIKQKKIIRTAKQYLQKNKNYQDFICRFDVVGVECDIKHSKIHWIKNAF